ncbi:MAG: NTP transferase domain-containing protein [Oscillospiraceae bacterium]|nr:NTP transferase domain-containing protein [Oscillospiraceae bacterium]MBQ9939516.1 NTP transferase domain-containing protein [Oscillospiraceae bacterium]
MNENKKGLAAIIMAGGEGTRLRPLTCNIPKPMVRLCGRPIIEYILALLEENGADTAALSLKYLAQNITDHFPDKKFGKLSLFFAEEDRPLGTAGSVKHTYNSCFADGKHGSEAPDHIIVVSGDALCDFDLKKAFDFHLTQGACATIIAKSVDDPREYGLIKASGDEVEAFIEKPAFSQAVSNLANTGVYILSRKCLEMIPDGVNYDFAKELFPKMLEQNKRIALFREEGYWCDIGDLKSYLSCQRDILEGKVNVARPFIRDRMGNIAEFGEPFGKFTVIPPVYIGRRVHVGDGAVIDKGSVLDDDCIVGEEAHINGSVLLEGSSVGSMSSVSRAVVCAGAVCKEKSMVFEDAVVGARAIVGRSARVNPGIKIWPHKNIPDGAVADMHVRFSAGRVCCFGEDGIEGSTGTELTAELCARIGAAAGTVFAKTTDLIAIGCSAALPSAAFLLSAASGALSVGTDVYDLGLCSREAFNFGMTLGSIKAGIWIDVSGGNTVVHIVQEGGLPAVRAVERGIENALASGEFALKDSTAFGKRTAINDVNVLYEAALKSAVTVSPETAAKTKISVELAQGGCAEKKELLEKLLQRLGFAHGIDIVIKLGRDGVAFCSAEGDTLSEHRVFGLCCMAELEKGNVAVGCGAPKILDGIAAKHGTKLLRYMSCPADDSDSEARQTASNQLWSRDVVLQALKAVNFMAENRFTVKKLSDFLPDFAVSSRTVPISKNPAEIVGQIDSLSSSRHTAHHSEKIGEGILLRTKGGYATIRPLKKGDGIKIVAEAENAETAEEICGFYEKLIEKLKSSALPHS